jgi:peptidylprolyl isomerase
MKMTLVSIGTMMMAILVVVSAGCLSSSTGSSSSPGAAETSGLNTPATQTLSGYIPSATPLITTPDNGKAESPQLATTGDTVSVYYTGTLENGTMFDSNMNSTEPLVFTLGKASVIPGFEEAVDGMSVNQVKTVTIPFEKAYGAYNSSLVQTINRVGPLANTNFVEGQRYTIHDKISDTYSSVKILHVTQTTITWDANNPLAGQNLVFTIKLAGITRP